MRVPMPATRDYIHFPSLRWCHFPNKKVATIRIRIKYYMSMIPSSFSFFCYIMYYSLHYSGRKITQPPVMTTRYIRSPSTFHLQVLCLHSLRKVLCATREQFTFATQMMLCSILSATRAQSSLLEKVNIFLVAQCTISKRGIPASGDY